MLNIERKKMESYNGEKGLVVVEEKKPKNKKAIVFVCFAFLTIILLILSATLRTTVVKGKAYYTKNEVALYILTFDGELPSNYITKSQAKKRYTDVSYYKDSYYEALRDGYSIGGGPHDYSNSRAEYNSHIAEYTDRTDLKECDIYNKTNRQIADEENRGECRFVYTVDGSEVFYTADHYTTFEKITVKSINGVANFFRICLIIVLCIEVLYIVYRIFIKKDGKQLGSDIGESLKIFFTVIFIVICSPFILVYAIVMAIKDGKKAV